MRPEPKLDYIECAFGVTFATSVKNILPLNLLFLTITLNCFCASGSNRYFAQNGSYFNSIKSSFLG